MATNSLVEVFHKLTGLPGIIPVTLFDPEKHDLAEGYDISYDCCGGVPVVSYTQPDAAPVEDDETDADTASTEDASGLLGEVAPTVKIPADGDPSEAPSTDTKEK